MCSNETESSPPNPQLSAHTYTGHCSNPRLRGLQTQKHNNVKIYDIWERKILRRHVCDSGEQLRFPVLDVTVLIKGLIEKHQIANKAFKRSILHNFLYQHTLHSHAMHWKVPSLVMKEVKTNGKNITKIIVFHHLLSQLVHFHRFTHGKESFAASVILCRNCQLQLRPSSA